MSDADAADKDIVEKAKTFIKGIPDSPYLPKKRLRAKACLGAVLSVMSPDWVFSKLDDRMKRVAWENLVKICKAWEQLAQL